MQQVGWDFDADVYINRFIPRPRLDLLPTPISWFLGYRANRRPRIGSVLVWFWAFIGAFFGILVVEAIFRTEALMARGTPTVIASLGAAAILEYNTIDSPLAQPRNALLGQLISSTVGITITKLFQLAPNFENLRWVAAPLAVGLSSAVMGATNTIHPPAGATALLAVTTPEITELGWFLTPLVLLGTILMLAVACLINNIQRRFPRYWWTAVPLSPPPLPSRHSIEHQHASSHRVSSLSTSEEGNADMSRHHSEYAKRDEEGEVRRDMIVLTADRIEIPDWISIDDEQKAMLELFRTQLQKGLRSVRSRDTGETRICGNS